MTILGLKDIPNFCNCFIESKELINVSIMGAIGSFDLSINPKDSLIPIDCFSIGIKTSIN
jgi:hypothetical protein